MSFGTLGQPVYGIDEVSEADTAAWQSGDQSGTISVRTEGLGYIAFLVVNGPLTIRNRAAVDQVIRTLTSAGAAIVAIIVQENTATVDAATTTLDAQAGIRAATVSPGVVLLEIPALGISTAMLADALVTSLKLAANLSLAGTTTIDTLAVSNNASLGNGNNDLAKITGRLEVVGGVFSVAPEAGAGATGTAVRTRGCDLAGRLRVSPAGAGVGAGTLCTVTFAQARPDANYDVWLQGASIDAGDLNATVQNLLSTGFQIRANAAPVAGDVIDIAFFVVED